MEPSHARFHSSARGDDQRRATVRDRDRILYSQPFLRLAGVTQVVTPGEGLTFHSRLTHSLKVGQVARRLAELLRSEKADEVEAAGGIDPEVAEAAGFAHDIGHPPFGHAAETQLRLSYADVLGMGAQEAEGYEGNAQAFRVLTRLAVHRAQYRGLNLTRSTLRGVLKYPWIHDSSDPKRREKYGAYSNEAPYLDWINEEAPPGERSLEAQAMDLADDLTYSVHDLQDFFRAGLIDPAAIGERLADYVEEWQEYLNYKAAHTPTDHNSRLAAAADAQGLEFYRGILTMFLGKARYAGTLDAKATLDLSVSTIIGQLLRSVTLSEHNGRWLVDLPEDKWAQLKFLQRIVWTEVIQTPRLASQQEGQRRIVDQLFHTFRRWIEDGAFERLPPVFAELVEEELGHSQEGSGEQRRAQLRFAADIVASLTDAEAVRLHNRFIGTSLGSITDLMPSSFT